MLSQQDPETGEWCLDYWSSSGPQGDLAGGDGTTSCSIDRIQRAVITRVTNPSAILQVQNLHPDDRDRSLAALKADIDASPMALQVAAGIGSQDFKQ